MYAKILHYLIFFLFFLGSPTIFAGDQTFPGDNAPIIRWKSQIALRSDVIKKPSLFSRLKNLLTGSPQQIFIRPSSLIKDSMNNLWITDPGDHCIVKINQQVGEITHLRPSAPLRLPSPIGIAQGPDNQIYITDSATGQILILDSGALSFQLFNDTLQLVRPTGIAYSNKNKQIWVVETGKHRIAIFNTHGRLIRYLGQRGNGPGEFNFPTFIHIDQNGTVYVVDSMNFRVQLFKSSGEWITMFGSIGDATGYFARPKGIATDSYGHIYVVDALFNAIQLFNKEGDFLFYFGEPGRDAGQFWLPLGIYIDSEDLIYIADSYNGRIQIFEFLQGGSHE
ncbi:MAG: 6-bladed beta-propeller [Calditrichaeota bacterium]|nr:6-bladed beta-propeller [Calditrichota bacterium]